MADYIPKPDLEGINSPDRQSLLKDAAILVAGFLAIVFTFYFVFVQVADWAFTKVSPQTEMRLLGKLWPERATAADMPEDFKSLIDSLVSDTKLPLKVSIRCDETPNAFALPGGVIYLTSGLFKTMKTENGVAFVLAHEIAHFINRDHIRGIGRQIIFMVGAGLFGFGDITSLKDFDSYIARGFDRNQEAEADRFAVGMVQRIYGHTWGAEEFFAELSKDETAITKVISSISSTHPLSSARLAFIRESQKGIRPKLKESNDHFQSWTKHCLTLPN